LVRRTLIISLALVGSALFAPTASAAGVDRLLAPESACPGQTDTSRAIAAQQRTLVCMHRFARRRAGRAKIRSAKVLRSSARRKARDLRRCQDFSHTACGRDAFYWFKRVGFTKGSWGAGENLYLGSGELAAPRAAMRGWLHSPIHRKVLLTSRYRRLGVSAVRGSYDGHQDVEFWVAHFGYRD
jgi:uncharacterized protein YkwD